MNDTFLGKVTQKGLVLFCLFLLLLLIGGCGSSKGDDPMACPGDPGCPDNPGPNVNMEGTWQGSTIAMDEELQTKLTLTQNDNNIEGILQLTFEDGKSTETEDVTGSISNSTVTISAVFPLQDGGQIEFGYEGTVSGDTYSGDVKLFKNGTNTNQGGPFSLTKNGTTSESDPSNFNGEWEIFEEQESENHYVQYRYTVSIEQTGAQAILSKGNDHMTCDVVGEELVCEGRFFYEEDSNNCIFDSYTLRHDGNNGLTGEASWTITYQGNNNYGQSNLTTIRPEVGSIHIYNYSDTTFPLVLIRPCDSDNWGENQNSNPLGPGIIWMLSSVPQDCYDIRMYEDTDLTEDTGYVYWDEITVNGGETSRLLWDPSRSLRLNQKGLLQKSMDPNQFTGSIVRAFKSSPIK
jgi:hypothetical protein